MITQDQVDTWTEVFLANPSTCPIRLVRKLDGALSSCFAPKPTKFSDLLIFQITRQVKERIRSHQKELADSFLDENGNFDWNKWEKSLASSINSPMI